MDKELKEMWDKLDNIRKGMAYAESDEAIDILTWVVRDLIKYIERNGMEVDAIVDIHKEHYDVLVRTPMICQNGHQRWLYHLVSRGDLRTLWGPRECDCKTEEIGEGFTASGPSQAVLEDAER